MAVTEKTTNAFVSGVHNLLPDEIVPADSATDELNWLTTNGRIELTYGRQAIGGQGDIGKNYGEHTGYRVDGTAVRFRKVGTTIQYLNGSTWTNVITGLTEVADYTFSNYQSLAGAFVYIFGVDGIYKICTANPADFASLYDSTKNFKGYGFIDKGRTILWGRVDDPTGLYGSWIDSQTAVGGGTGVYTSVSGESIGSSGSTNYTGTLAFKAGGATRTCFGVSITDGTETFTDDFNGNLTGDAGGTGTINYMTGDYDVTFNSVTGGAVTADYQWENSNLRGVTDFSKSATRLAGEGFVLRQDVGGDAIKTVLLLDGSYFSLKERSAYQLTLDAEDTDPTNVVFRRDIGVLSLRSAVATGRGIVFMNTANPSKPQLNILRRNTVGDNFDVEPLFPQFSFEDYTYDDALLDTWDKYIIVGCKSGAGENDRLLLCNILDDTVDITYYGIRTSTKVAGVLYGGDPLTKSTYELFTGFDDLGIAIENYWEGAADTYGSSALKRTKKFRFKGKIDSQQSLEVYIGVDNGDYQLIGTILGTGDYVDYGITYAIGTSFIGFDVLGGGDSTDVYEYFIEIKTRLPKFRKRQIKFVATGIGYVSVERMTDFDIWRYQDKMPSKYRLKQNVSLDGATTDQDEPEY